MHVSLHFRKDVKSFLIDADEVEWIKLRDTFGGDIRYLNKVKKYVIARSLKNYAILKDKFNATFSDGVMEVVNKRIQLLKEHDEDVKKIEVINSSIVDFSDYEFKTKPWEHQLKALALAIEAKSLGLLMDMRTGKTYVLSNLVEMAKANGQPYKTLVLCPKQIMYDTWVKDVHKHTDLKVNVAKHPTPKATIEEIYAYRTVTRGGYKQREFGEPDITVLNHDAVRNKDILEALKDKHFNILIIDESHKYKTLTSKRTKALLSLRDTVDRVFISTGTLITRSPEDAYSQMEILNPYILNMTHDEFKARYCYYKHLPHRGFSMYLGPNKKALPELWQRIDRHCFKVAIEDCHDMPELLYTKHIVEMNAEERKYHTELFDDLITYVNSCDKEKHEIKTTTLGKLTKLSQITSGFVYDDGEPVRILNSSKIEELREVLKEIICENRKVIIWAHFIQSRAMISELLKEMKIKFARIDTSVDDTSAEIAKFTNDKDCSVILCSQSCGAEGMDLSPAKYTIYYDNSFMYEHRKQSERRFYTHLSKQLHGKNVVIIDMCAEDSVDQIILDSLTNKQDLSEFINAKVLNDYYSKFEEE